MASGQNERRRRILESAGRLFAERGYERTGIDDIGDGAGVTGPAIYRHFSGKQEILDQLLVTQMEAVLTNARAAAGLHDSPLELLEELLVARIDLSLGPLGHLGTVFQRAEVRCSDEARAQLRGLRAAYEDEWLRVLVQLAPTESVEALRVAIHATLVLIGYGSMRVLRGEVVAANSIGDAQLRTQILEMAWAAILAVAPPVHP